MTTSREELPKHAAACALETGVEVTEDGEAVFVDLDPKGVLNENIRALTAGQARLLADALLEAASSLEGQGLKRQD